LNVFDRELFENAVVLVQVFTRLRRRMTHPRETSGREGKYRPSKRLVKRMTAIDTSSEVLTRLLVEWSGTYVLIRRSGRKRVIRRSYRGVICPWQRFT